MDLSVIIVSWNVKEKLRDNLEALFKSQNVSFEVFVVDNNSKDNTVEVVKNNFPDVKLIANQENLGFAKANNQAIKLAKGRYILLLNPDMRVFDNTLSDMVFWMDKNKQAMVAGCKLVDENKKIVKHVRCFPALADQLAIILKIPHIFPTVLNKYLRNDFDYTISAKVDSVRGGFFMIRKEAIEKIGLLDERFFLWFEEVDYCKRVKQFGGEVWYAPVAECIDLIGQSFKQLDRGMTQKYFRNSMLKYFKKQRPIYEYWILKIIWPIGMFMVWVGKKLKIKNKAKT
ncbi:MAG: glycosyltransferase family 2 protein [bacterium]|nr:glycosyltransferase family 2 protein [bacterium]